MRTTRTCGFGLALLLLASCGGQKKMVETTGQIRTNMIAGDYAGALATLRASKKTGFKEQDRVAYWMNEGMLLHLLGKYKESTAVLQKAERRSKELFTKSMRKEVKAAFTSQAATDYAGEDYEKVLLNVFKALNFIGLSKTSGALVEARRINEKLEFYNTKYQRKNVYNQDAFAHWLMGMLFEIEGTYDSARIAYKRAFDVYRGDFAANYGLQMPPYVGEDVVRIAVRGGDTDLVEKLRAETRGSGATAALLKKTGEVVLFHLNGEGPTKSDYFVECIFKSAVDFYCDAEPGGEFMRRTKITVTRAGYTVVKVAFPQLHLHPPSNPYIAMKIGGTEVRSVPALPISQIAAKTLRDKTNRIFKKAIVRAITKALTQNAAGSAGSSAGGEDLGWLAKTATSVTMQATEEADKRAWTTLPSRIEVARAFVAPGVHNVELKLPNGKVARINNVKVEAGKRVFLTYRTIP